MGFRQRRGGTPDSGSSIEKGLGALKAFKGLIIQASIHPHDYGPILWWALCHSGARGAASGRVSVCQELKVLMEGGIPAGELGAEAGRLGWETLRSSGAGRRSLDSGQQCWCGWCLNLQSMTEGHLGYFLFVLFCCFCF